MVRGECGRNEKLTGTNPKCIGCTKKCKQKAYVKVVYCPNYIPKKVTKNGDD